MALTLCNFHSSVTIITLPCEQTIQIVFLCPKNMLFYSLEYYCYLRMDINQERQFHVDCGLRHFLLLHLLLDPQAKIMGLRPVTQA